MSSDPVGEYGFTAVPRDLEKLLEHADVKNDPPKKFTVDDVLPEMTGLAKEVQDYAHRELPERTFNHSMRVICFGLAIHKQYLSSPTSPRLPQLPYILSSLLHDIGTTPTNMSSTHLSFEFSGGFTVHSLLSSLSAPTPLTESVVEAIIRHQDIGPEGYLTIVGGVLQVATVLDNTGKNIELLDQGFIDEVCQNWPRKGWNGCFADVAEEEMRRKPWSHTTKLGEAFVGAVRGNEGMRKWE